MATNVIHCMSLFENVDTEKQQIQGMILRFEECRGYILCWGLRESLSSPYFSVSRGFQTSNSLYLKLWQDVMLMNCFRDKIFSLIGLMGDKINPYLLPDYSSSNSHTEVAL